MFAIDEAVAELRRDVAGLTGDQVGAALRQLAALRAALDACEARVLAPQRTPPRPGADASLLGRRSGLHQP